MLEQKRWGASPEAWFHLDLIMGCTEKLLPVVCNPNAQVSPDSSLKSIGKTPSRYNRSRQVVGIPKWTEKISTDSDITAWAKEPDYGICMRTGLGELAIDCDSENGNVQAQIQALLIKILGKLPPRRYRDNSNKCLYLLSVKGEYRKRIHRLANDLGIIELLADGQQFVAAGTHPSGARIQWDGGLPSDPLEVTPEQLEMLWSALAEHLPVTSSTEANAAGKLRDRSIVTPNATDEIADYLDANGWTVSFGKNGERYIKCPFESGHSIESDTTSTAYFPAGTAGFEQGHFKCLHGSCAHRNDGDFKIAIGFGKDDFEDLTELKEDEPAFTDIDMDMTSHFLERFIYVVKGDQVCDLSRPPYRSIMDMKSFKNLMAPYQFPAVGKGKKEPVPATKKWLEHPKKVVAETIGYRPGEGRLIRGLDGWLEINEFYLPQHPKVTNFDKVKNVFLKHMDYLLPDEKQRLFFIARLAWMVQRPARRCPITTLHISVLHGTGRGWVIQLMEAILGVWNCTRAKMDVICANQFHDYLYHSLLCTVDEVKENIDTRYSINDQLRDLLTEPRFEVNNKYGKKITMDIFTSFLFFSNHIDALFLPEEDRRIAVLGGPDFLQNENYFNPLYQALKDPEFIAQVYWYLMAVNLDEFDWQRAPETEERRLMIESSRSDVDTVLFELIANPPVAAMTYQQIVNYIALDIGLEADINPKRVSNILRSKGLSQASAIKFNGKKERPWLLAKNYKASSNEHIRAELEKCEKLLNVV
ncbi:DUF5906 domain-containing protein [Xenorhabdus szentirmaii]|uniref:NrS-1 polymerase-like helicase domain-containing protein n=1 Tax=Xenorhabdus szentirmaii DSM 16338 TaxID=1427518 RepID=W1J3Q8_9GAMM|nr:DUF5906 domain-containing protein [Xenorhabdus szentirmaii]PHM31988.1 DNA primase [Xenorhabdus szentirmaii DSM 16338]CDL85392.1 hypothetical protein XSR1_70130 [Xenorhabdus szentirmaii DSM 16338]